MTQISLKQPTEFDTRCGKEHPDVSERLNAVAVIAGACSATVLIVKLQRDCTTNPSRWPAQAPI